MSVNTSSRTSLVSVKENHQQNENEESTGKTGKKFVKSELGDVPSVDELLRRLKRRMSGHEYLEFERRNIHLSRPDIPQPKPGGSQDVPPETPYINPKYLKHLSTLLEREIDHTADVAQEMQASHAEDSQILSVYNVMRQLTRLRLQLFRFQEQPTAAALEIGGPREIEMHLENIETVCNAAKEIVLQYSEDADVGELNCNRRETDFHKELIERVPLRRTSYTTSHNNQVNQFDHNFSELNTQINEGRTNNTKEYLENYRRLETRKKKKCQLENEKNKNKLLYKSGTVQESQPDTDTDDEMANINNLQSENKKYQWPRLDTMDKNRIHEEEELHSLMSEIDEMLVDVGLTKKKTSDEGLSYEVVMMGSGEMNNSEKLIPKKKSVAPKFAAKTFKPMKDTKTVLKPKKQVDPFMDELEKMLDECDLQQ